MGRSTARFLAGVLAVAGIAPRVAAAEPGPPGTPEKARCAAAYEHAQELRRANRLTEARRELLVCEQSCPSALAVDCKQWQNDVEALTPTVRLRATNASGQAVDVRVLLDGAPLADHVERDAIPVDPGDHTFHFVAASGETTDVRVSLHAGEHDRTIDAVLVPPASAMTPSPTQAAAPGSDVAVEGVLAAPHSQVSLASSRGSIPLGVWILGGLGVAGLGVGATLSLIGHADSGNLEAKCAPRCDPSEVDAVRTKYTAAWISGGIGLAALSAAVLIWHPWQKQEAASAFFVAPAGGGAIVGWRGEN